MTQCATTALAGAVPCPCVRGARGRFGGLAPVPGVMSLPFPPPRPACPALRVAGRPVRVSLTLARWYAIPRSLCVPRARSGCPSGSPRVPFACVCARAPAASARPPWLVWRAHLARSRHWALVGPFHVVRAPPRVLPRSLAPSGVLGAGRSGPGSPLPGLGLCAPRGAGPWRSCAGGRVWGGGRPVCRAPRLCGRGGQYGGGSLCLVPSLCLPWVGNKAGVTGVVLVMAGVVPIPLRFVLACLLWARSVRRPGALARARLFLAVPLEAGGWGGGAGRAPAPLSGGGGGTIPSASGGGGRRPRGLRAAGGAGGGGGSRRGLPAPPLGCGPRFPTLAPLLSLAHSPPACAFGRGRGAAPGGGDEGRPVNRSPAAPSDLNPPSALPEWAMVMGGVRGGGASILFWCAAVRRSQAWSARRSGALVWARPSVATPAGAGGLGRWGAQCAGPAASPPLASRSLLGEGGRPLGSGGAEHRSCGPQAWGGGRGGGLGGPPRRSPPPRPVGRRPAIRCLRRAPPGVYSCRGGCRAAAGVKRGLVGRQGVSAAGGGGGEPPRPGSRPSLPQAGL